MCVFVSSKLAQVADGMAFLHSTNPPILHRDLRCGNLFITSTDVIKVCCKEIAKKGKFYWLKKLLCS